MIGGPMAGRVVMASSLWLVSMLAQTETMPGVPGSGWVGAGLLGAVLAWLMFKHLPDKDRQLKELVTLFQSQIIAKDNQLTLQLGEKDKQLEVKDTSLRAQLEKKDEQIDRVLDRRTEESKEMLKAFDMQVRQMHAENQTKLDKVIQHCKEETTKSNDAFMHDLNRLGEAIEDLASLLRDNGMIRTRRRRNFPPSTPDNPEEGTEGHK